MPIDDLMTQFRLASRQLFNQFYRVSDPYNNDGWPLEERFSHVQEALFQTLVVEPAKLPATRYGDVNPGISVELRQAELAPIMLNRDVDSGYWDHPIREVTREARMAFVRFFDWDQLDVRDNRYVRVLVQAWPSKPEAIGKHALIEAQYVKFTAP
jgi:hypothetical protein